MGQAVTQGRRKRFNLRIESLVIESTGKRPTAQHIERVSISELRVLLLRVELC